MEFKRISINANGSQAPSPPKEGAGQALRLGPLLGLAWASTTSVPKDAVWGSEYEGRAADMVLGLYHMLGLAVCGKSHGILRPSLVFHILQIYFIYILPFGLSRPSRWLMLGKTLCNLIFKESNQEFENETLKPAEGKECWGKKGTHECVFLGCLVLRLLFYPHLQTDRPKLVLKHNIFLFI